MEKNLLLTKRKYLFVMLAIFCMSLCSWHTQAQDTPCIDGVSSDWGDGGFMSGQSSYELNHDVFIGNDDDIFTGGKDFKDWGLPSPTPDYSNWTFSSMQAKSDIMNASAAIVTGLTPSDGCGDYGGIPYDPTHTYLFFAGDRESNNGTGYIGFWFCLNGTEPVEVGKDKYFAPEHFTNFGEDNGEGGTYDAETCAGDILILANFENGGRIADVTVLKWVGPGNGTEGNNLSLYPIGLTSQVGTNNDTPTPVPPGWIVPDGQIEYDYFEFFEGIVDLTPIFDLVGDPKILCKATWMLETRSSKEITADSKDFVGGNFNIAPTVEVSDDDVCENGSASLTATLKDASGTPISPAGYTFTWSGPGSFNGQGTPTISFASVHLSDAGNYTVTVTSETFCEPDEPGTATLSVYDNPVCSVVTTDQSSYYAVDGTAKVNVTGAEVNTYYWTDGDGIAIPDANGQGTDSIWGLSMGRYYVYIIDVNGCETSCDDSLGWVPTAPTCAVTPTPVTCFGGSDGSVEVYITSYPNVPPFTYILKDVSDNPLDTIVSNDTTVFFTGLPAGVYLFDVYDGIDPNATFCNGEITQPDEVTLTCPENMSLGSCLTQDSVNAAFDIWLASVSSSGSDSMMTDNWNQVYPNACGDSITVRFSLNDPCLEPNYCEATFVVSAAPAISATPPDDLTLGTCLSQDSVNAAYDAWAASGVVEGGCGLVVDIDKSAAPDACGGEVVVTWTISSDCADTIVAMRTFKVTAAPAISATPPEDLTLGTCLSQDSVNTAYDAWAASGVVEGGCGLVVDIDKPAAPDACGGEVVVTWTISSDCADTIVAMRTFKVTAAPAISATPPEDLTLGT
ncbi:hypothetical protein, partial [Maribellus sp. YY47]|uniref:hypothetical protein n=1 Tax=Maribellus sp. YY47 TaxID=2929486 RepID=UPI0020011989